MLLASSICPTIYEFINTFDGRKSCGLKNVVCRCELEISQEAAQTGLATGQVVVVPEGGEKSCADTRLFWVDLPGVQVEDERKARRTVEMRERGSCQLIRVQPEIAATATGKRCPRKLNVEGGNSTIV